MEFTNKVQLLSRMPMLGTLSSSDIEQLATAAQSRKTTKFQFVFLPDERADYLYFLYKGKLKIGTFSAEGREVIKEILQPETPFGDSVLAGESIRVDFAQAMHEDVEYLAIPMSEFQRHMQSTPQLMQACIQYLCSRLQRVEHRLSSLVLKDARERIIDFLVESAGREGRRVGLETLVKHHLTQQEIASLTGTSRQTVTSVLNDLRKSNLIYFNRSSILIRDLQRLA
jgi:CRP/FNR family transcriptional regulator, cyclic AMP receptor protein